MATALLTPTEAAERLGVHPNSIRRWIAEGRVPSALRTPGRGLRLPESALGELLRPAGPPAAAGDCVLDEVRR